MDLENKFTDVLKKLNTKDCDIIMKYMIRNGAEAVAITKEKIINKIKNCQDKDNIIIKELLEELY